MALQITFKQMKRFAFTIVTLLIIWFVMGHFAWVKTTRNDQLQQVDIDYYFLAPMNVHKALDRFDIVSEIPHSTVKYRYQWLSPFHLSISISEKNKPQGVEYRYSFNKSRALIPPFTVSKAGTICTKVEPKLLSISPTKNAPTTGPILLHFNTPIQATSIQAKVHCEINGRLVPVKNDYTNWQFAPNKRFEHQRNYTITIDAGLMSVHGTSTSQQKQVTFNTAPEFIITESYPRNGDNSVWLSRNIKFTTNQPIKEAKISGAKGKITINDNTILFTPNRTFTPSTNYKITANITSIYGEVINSEIAFRTTNLGNKPWLEVKAGSPCKIWLMKGNKELKNAEGWFTKDLNNLPRVTMYESDRDTGEVIKRTKERLPWIRLNTDIMLHATDYTGVDNHNKLGIPKTYSCLLLPTDIVAELFSTYPKGFMVIVH